jgi:hypothetical protein
VAEHRSLMAHDATLSRVNCRAPFVRDVPTWVSAWWTHRAPGVSGRGLRLAQVSKVWAEPAGYEAVD